MAFLPGCVVMTSGPVSMTQLQHESMGAKEVAFVAPTPYLADMTKALAAEGFKVMTDPNPAGANWGLTMTARDLSTPCAFTPASILDFAVVVTDLHTGQVVATLQQKGSDGPCTTVQPVFPTLAAKLADLWSSTPYPHRLVSSPPRAGFFMAAVRRLTSLYQLTRLYLVRMVNYS
jgi:hypothetical protein